MYQKRTCTNHHRAGHMNLCDCPFCVATEPLPEWTESNTILCTPRLVQITIAPFGHHAFWGFLMRRHDTFGTRIAIYCPERKDYCVHHGVREAIEYCTSVLDFRDFTQENIDTIASNPAAVVLRDGTPIDQVDMGITRFVPNVDIKEGPLCTAHAPPPVLSDRRPVKRTRRSSVQPPTTANHTNVLTERPPSPMVTDDGDSGATYDLRSIGGDLQRIQDAHEARSEWDSEVVLEILESAGVPPLITVNAVINRPKYREVECVFRQPSGLPTKPVFVPMSIMLFRYRREMERFV